MPDSNRRHNRITIETRARSARGSRPPGRPPQPRSREWITALTIIGAAGLATFIALVLTSRPYNPMNSTLAPVRTVPAGSLAQQPSPKPSPNVAASPQQNQTTAVTASPEPTSDTIPDDAGIEAQIEKTLAADSILSKLDVSTLVESGKVTIVGSVRSADLKQRVEKVVSGIKGVTSVDNQLVVLAATP